MSGKTFRNMAFLAYAGNTDNDYSNVNGDYIDDGVTLSNNLPRRMFTNISSSIHPSRNLPSSSLPDVDSDVGDHSNVLRIKRNPLRKIYAITAMSFCCQIDSNQLWLYCIIQYWRFSGEF